MCKRQEDFVSPVISSEFWKKKHHHIKLSINKTEKPFSLQDDEKEGTIMTELVKFFSPNKEKPKQQPKELPKQ